jgi:hypothetical protein
VSAWLFEFWEVGYSSIELWVRVCVLVLIYNFPVSEEREV